MASVATYSFAGLSAATFSITGLPVSSVSVGNAAYRLLDASGAFVKESGLGQIWIIEV